MDWARTSCWISRAGGLTSREEYSTAGSEVSVLESFRVGPGEAGSWVRSIAYDRVSRRRSMYQDIRTASIHHPFSSSRRTMRDLSVSTESTASPFEKLL